MLSARFFRFFSHLNFATLKETVVQVGTQRLPGLSAEMAYSSMLALFPAIVAVLTAIGSFKSQGTLENLAQQLSIVAPEEVQKIIQTFLKEIRIEKTRGLISVSFLAALWVSSGAMNSAMTALDHIHQIPAKLIRPFWKAKLVSLTLTIGTILLLVLASTLVFVSDVIIKLVATSQGGMIRQGLLTSWRLLSWPLALGIVAMTFAFIYRYGPSRWNRGTPILPGAILAAVFWAVLSGLFRSYVSHFGNYNKVYGTLGAVIVLMLWLYLSSLVMLIGGQLNVTVGEAMRRSQQARKERVKR
jgi:membrane protein